MCTLQVRMLPVLSFRGKVNHFFHSRVHLCLDIKLKDLAVLIQKNVVHKTQMKISLIQFNIDDTFIQFQSTYPFKCYFICINNVKVIYYLHRFLIKSYQSRATTTVLCLSLSTIEQEYVIYQRVLQYFLILIKVLNFY